jgi:hypothetical protein
MRDQTCEGNEPQERRRTRYCSREGPLVWQGRATAPGMRVAERRAKRTRRCMTRPGGEITERRSKEQLDRRVRRERAGRNMRRVGFTDPTRATDRQTTELESTRSCSSSASQRRRDFDAESQDWARTRPPDRATRRHVIWPIKRKTAGAKRSPIVRSVARSAGDQASAKRRSGTRPEAGRLRKIARDAADVC